MNVQEFTDALDYIAHHRGEAVQILFPGDEPHRIDYRQEWIERNVHAFWCHLDERNRVKVLALAKAYYFQGLPNKSPPNIV